MFVFYNGQGKHYHMMKKILFQKQCLRDPGKDVELQQQHTFHRLHHSLQVKKALLQFFFLSVQCTSNQLVKYGNPDL